MGTRALTYVEPYKLWIVTQFDGYPNGLGRNLRKAIKEKLSKEDFINYINSKCEIRSKGNTEKEALKDYFCTIDIGELQKGKDSLIEFVWKLNKDWKLEKIKEWEIGKLK